MLSEETLHLLVLDDSSNDAETVANMLRNAGHAVHAGRIEDDEDLREGLAQDNCDLVLAKPKIPFLTADEALDIIRQTKKEVPLLVIADEADEEQITALLKAGAKDAVQLSQPQRLGHAVLREITAYREYLRLCSCEHELEEANKRAQSLVESSRDAITYIHDGMYIYANDAYLEMFGYSDMEEIEGMPILNMVNKDEHSRFKKFLRDFNKGKADSTTIDVTGLRPDGSDFNITMEFTPASFDGERCTQIIIRAQANSEELERKLNDMSKLDLLTGAYNRQYFLDAFHGVNGKPGKEGAIYYLSPDHFKQLQTELGISKSDQLLAELAKLINSQLTTDHDFLARFEGEYFTVLLHDYTPEHAESFAEKLCRCIDDHTFEMDGNTIGVTCSIGIAFYSEATDDPQEVFNRASKAHQEAIQAGGNRYRTYIPGEEEMAEQERMVVIAKQIKLALRNNTMQLLFQPIVSLKGDENENYEVFLRMQDDKNNTLLPSEFLPAAEKGGLMPAIDRWVVAHSIKAVTEQRRKGKPVVLFVKLSGASLRDEKLLPWMRDILKAAHAEPNSIVIEVSEEVASTNLKPLKMLIDGLSQLHVGLALDHFGLAPNANNLLKNCNAQFIKLAASIVGELSHSKEAQDKVKEITAMAADSKKSVVANSVEDPHTLATIYSTGIDYIQGYFLQEPTDEMDYDFSSMG